VDQAELVEVLVVVEQVDHQAVLVQAEVPVHPVQADHLGLVEVADHLGLVEVADHLVPQEVQALVEVLVVVEQADQADLVEPAAVQALQDQVVLALVYLV
jgi:predicted LPLAT superfamily acyltransferase